MADEIERKFLVSSFDDNWPVSHKVSTIEQTYLLNEEEGVSDRIRCRFYPGESPHTAYTHTIKKRVGPGHSQEDEREISAVEYTHLKTRADPSRVVIHKARLVFDWKGWTFELDVFRVPADVNILEVELPSLDAKVELPPFIHIEKEVTDDKAWSNASLSERSA